jgi:hypothetical protein
MEIDNAFRIGNKHGARTIVVKFVSTWKKEECFRAKKVLKQTGYSLFEDLPKATYELLKLAQKKYGHKSAWTLGGKVFIQRNNIKKIINSIEDINENP